MLIVKKEVERNLYAVAQAILKVAGQRTKAVDVGDSSVQYRYRDKWM
jgi:hypothetical protein